MRGVLGKSSFPEVEYSIGCPVPQLKGDCVTAFSSPPPLLLRAASPPSQDQPLRTRRPTPGDSASHSPLRPCSNTCAHCRIDAADQHERFVPDARSWFESLACDRPAWGFTSSPTCTRQLPSQRSPPEFRSTRCSAEMRARNQLLICYNALIGSRSRCTISSGGCDTTRAMRRSIFRRA